MAMPLEGVRALDLGRVWSGPLAARIMGDFGAQVIRVESTAGRGEYAGAAARQSQMPQDFPRGDPGRHPWNRGSMFNDLNRNKLSLTLDLSKPDGVDIFKRLVKVSDVVVENYTPRVMANFGLDYPALKTVREDIIMLSMPAFGMTGLYRDFPGYGNTIEPVAGITNLVGYAGGPPQPLGMIAGDALAALHGVSAVLVALWERRRTGRGQHIDLSQAETQTSAIGEVIVGYSMTGASPARHGNRHPFMAPHGCYRCKGDDAWAVLAVSSDEEWRGLCRAMGNPAWAENAGFSDQLSRWHNQDEMDVQIEAWTVERDHCEVMRLLQAAGVPCGAVLNGREVLEDGHLNERGFFWEIPHPDAGAFPYAGVPFRLSKSPPAARLPAPCLGEHNWSVLKDLLRMGNEEIARLGNAGIIGDRPPGVTG